MIMMITKLQQGYSLNFKQLFNRLNRMLLCPCPNRIGIFDLALQFLNFEFGVVSR